MVNSSDLILASGSPRRKQLMSAAGIGFEAMESGVAEEPRSGEDATEFARRMAREKALAISERAPRRLVLAADTVVECRGAIFGKPESAADAERMLRALSGVTHRVVTAFSIVRGRRILESEAVTSHVTFRNLSEREIGAYLATGEPFDKAGAYGIQGMGASLIASVDGARDNVMGLPMAEVLTALRRHLKAVQHSAGADD